ncbi:hypothetical protein PCANC_04809 [Puccinia coronata f. sp. avenae]|uniref:Uncharacterized protein n=1 Tax=Puccinia coronata f. sp. avenae TaxID=200324 RepID=A0A2N5VCJ2_9BASI|nr:hypothetical protein PCANC_20130 [Puccinia coronata f. sp. avenae]PLW47701.1 hypothetical protein PCASD_04113 [Puccinia coronata f. sp. avenae]PLW56471.1 hypothetical protein PCANC_04809 [Puccinia coronata f. sp. avenae]
MDLPWRKSSLANRRVVSNLDPEKGSASKGLPRSFSNQPPLLEIVIDKQESLASVNPSGHPVYWNRKVLRNNPNFGGSYPAVINPSPRRGSVMASLFEVIRSNLRQSRLQVLEALPAFRSGEKRPPV